MGASPADGMVVRGYLTRAVDPDDRRRLTIALTERGEAAPRTIRAAVDGIDAEVGARSVTQAWAVLVAVIGAGEEAPESPRGPTRPRPTCRALGGPGGLRHHEPAPVH